MISPPGMTPQTSGNGLPPATTTTLSGHLAGGVTSFRSADLPCCRQFNARVHLHQG